MVDRFDLGRLGDYVLFCDICGQKCYASESSKLSTYTGRGGLIVCPNDVDAIDYGLVPYLPPAEKNVPFTRINHTYTGDCCPIFDLEGDTVENISNYLFLLTSQNEWLTVSQDVLLATSQEV